MEGSYWGAARFQEFAKQYTKYTHEAHLVESATSAHHHCHCTPDLQASSCRHGEHSNVPLLIDFYFIFIRSTRSQLAVLLLSLFLLACKPRKEVFFSQFHGIIFSPF